MCGIAGVWALRNYELSQGEFARFFSAIQHRGPDGSEISSLLASRISLGFHRLAIVDLSSSAMQPMESKNGRYKLLFNGEIYNHNELRAVLRNRGHQFSTSSDSEVVLAAYEEWGSNCLKEFNGMWAIVIWDSLEQKLFCARDRYGVKPFYFGSFDGRFYFSSELKSFCHIPNNSSSLNREALNGALDVDTLPITLLSGVQKLVPGEAMIVENSGIIKKFIWWDSLEQLSEPKKVGSQAVIDEFSDLFYSSCFLRASCDVPFAISLSGGLDSSSVLAFTLLALRKENPERINTMRLFHQTFANSPEDETIYAQIVAENLGMNLTLTQLNSNITQADVRNAVLALESNSINPIGIWAHYKAIRSHGFSVVLEGHGSDELFAGYPFMGEDYAKILLKRFRIGSWSQMQHLVTQITVGNVQMEQNRNLLQLLTRDIKNIFNSKSKPVKDYLRNLHNSSTVNISIETQEMIYHRNRRIRRCFRELEPLTAIRFVNFHYKTLPNILNNFDKLSMAHGVEIRSPFLDWRIVNFILSQRENLFLKDDFSKWMLRMSVRGHLPAEITFRKAKRGFAPSIFWMRDSLRELAQEIVNDSNFLTFSDVSEKEFRENFNSAYASEDWNKLLGYWGTVQLNILTREMGIVS